MTQQNPSIIFPDFFRGTRKLRENVNYSLQFWLFQRLFRVLLWYPSHHFPDFFRKTPKKWVAFSFCHSRLTFEPRLVPAKFREDSCMRVSNLISFSRFSNRAEVCVIRALQKVYVVLVHMQSHILWPNKPLCIVFLDFFWDPGIREKPWVIDFNFSSFWRSFRTFL